MKRGLEADPGFLVEGNVNPKRTVLEEPWIRKSKHYEQKKKKNTANVQV